MNLAKKISIGDMKSIAIGKFELEKSEVDNLGHNKSPVEINFEILVLWRNKSSDNTKEVRIQP